jgi:hypothetical protein
VCYVHITGRDEDYGKSGKIFYKNLEQKLPIKDIFNLIFNISKMTLSLLPLHIKSLFIAQ